LENLQESMGRCFIKGKTFKKAWEGALLMGVLNFGRHFLSLKKKEM
jgi:hypothetical protein